MKYILLHGLGQAPSSWNKTVSLLYNRDDLAIPNLWDFIRADTVCYESLYAGFAEYADIINEPFSLCGLSLGGILALQYALENPMRVSSLALIGTQFSMPKGLIKLQNIMFRFMPNKMFEDMGVTKKQFMSLCSSMAALDFTEKLSDIQCPTLVIYGEKDSANRKAAIQLEKRIPHASLHMISGASHEVNTDAPDCLATLLNNFWDKL
ncbi:MAG: alpha/beta hydrolase [Oscillospiraceae bacterium]|nr:alpha/beta hydrolase [Oscillospiraceae bacterium]